MAHSQAVLTAKQTLTLVMLGSESQSMGKLSSQGFSLGADVPISAKPTAASVFHLGQVFP